MAITGLDQVHGPYGVYIDVRWRNILMHEHRSALRQKIRIVGYREKFRWQIRRIILNIGKYSTLDVFCCIVKLVYASLTC